MLSRSLQQMDTPCFRILVDSHNSDKLIEQQYGQMPQQTILPARYLVRTALLSNIGVATVIFHDKYPFH